MHGPVGTVQLACVRKRRDALYRLFIFGQQAACRRRGVKFVDIIIYCLRQITLGNGKVCDGIHVIDLPLRRSSRGVLSFFCVTEADF